MATRTDMNVDPATLCQQTGTSLIGFSLTELVHILQQMDEKAYRAEQIYTWMYRRGVADFSQMSNVAKSLQHKLQACYTLKVPAISLSQVARDGTRKYAFALQDGSTCEAVFIPEVAKGSNTNTLCISSQTGCAVGCKFCFTASITKHRNLSVHEIVGQVLAVARDLKQANIAQPITNIVFMGMGEPLLNYANVVAAIERLMDPMGMDFSARRITVSTAGIVPQILPLGQAVPIQLAISLNATTDAIRNEIMPINKKWPLATLLATLHAYPLRHGRRITIEYVLLAGINDSDADAHRLSQLLSKIPVKINLLPLNDHERTIYQPPAAERVHRFQQILRAAGYNTLIRTQRGQDIGAACGRLGQMAKVEQVAAPYRSQATPAVVAHAHAHAQLG